MTADCIEITDDMRAVAAAALLAVYPFLPDPNYMADKVLRCALRAGGYAIDGDPSYVYGQWDRLSSDPPPLTPQDRERWAQLTATGDGGG